MDRRQLIAAVEAQERLRGSMPDDVVDTTIEVLRRRLQELDASQHRRRQVTVLFADIQGFTSMSERLDAERVTAVMNDVWMRLDQIVRDRGGSIDKHIGDAVMAVWGVDESMEDDPEQAVRAALALLDALARFREDTGHDLKMRVGVHTGRVMLGAVGSVGEVTAMGDTVNVASRLEHSAPVGGILVSHDTYRHVRGVFDVRPLDPIVLRGRAQPIRVYEVNRAKPLAFRVPTRGVEGVETRMIGRDREFGALQEAFADVTDGRGSRMVTVIGEAGVGKSRLLYEFGNWLELHERTAYYFKGRAGARRRRVPFGLLRDAMAARCDVNESDATDVVRDKLRAGLSVALEPAEALLVGRWLGFDLEQGDGAQVQAPAERIGLIGRALLVRYLRTLADDAPVVVFFEDLHWADDESLDVITNVFESISDEAILVVAATRPDLFEHRPDWGDDDRRALRVDLVAFVSEDARSLVREVLREAEPLPDELVDFVTERADGNPFYIEELVKMLVDDGVIDPGDEGWTVRAELIDRARVPSTLTGVLQARLDSLPEAALRTLQRAAVIGRIFWLDAIAALGDGQPVDLDLAIERELVHQRRPSALDHTPEFVFRHALLHDVTYETVLLSERPALHAAAADWIDNVAGDRVDEYLVELAEHRQRAGQTDLAAACFERAARAAVGSGAVESAYGLALAVLDVGEESAPATLVGALVTAARCSRLLGRHPVALREVERAIEIARGLDDVHMLFSALYEASIVVETMGDHGRCRRLLDEALPLAQRTTDDDLSSALTRLAWSDLNAGDTASATTRAALSLELAERAGATEPLSRALVVSAAIAAKSADLRTAIRNSERALELTRASGDVVSEVDTLTDLGVSWHFLGDAEQSLDAYRRAERAYRRAIELGRELALATVSGTLANLAQLLIRMGEPMRGLELAREALELNVSSGALGESLFTILVHAEGLAACGDVDTALDHVIAVRAHPALGMLRDEVSQILDRFGADHGVHLEHELARRDVIDFEVVVRYILDSDRT